MDNRAKCLCMEKSQHVRMLASSASPEDVAWRHARRNSSQRIASKGSMPCGAMQDAERRRLRRRSDTAGRIASNAELHVSHDDANDTTEKEIDMTRSAATTYLCTLVLLAGCANMTDREQRVLSGAAIGTGVGAAAGAIGGNLGLGAALGAAGGAAAGLLVDDQKRKEK
jgi:osmotically inducible lipoprotein OsmB